MIILKNFAHLPAPSCVLPASLNNPHKFLPEPASRSIVGEILVDSPTKTRFALSSRKIIMIILLLKPVLACSVGNSRTFLPTKSIFGLFSRKHRHSYPLLLRNIQTKKNTRMKRMFFFTCRGHGTRTRGAFALPHFQCGSLATRSTLYV